MSGGNTSYTGMGRLSRARAREFNIVSSYKLGYRNREDITNLPPGVLIVGSQNALTNISDRIQIRQGYELDGATNDIVSTQGNSFDWITRGNGEVHVRSGGLTTAGNDGKLQYRYVASDGTITWRDLVTGQSSVAYDFTTFWNSTESVREMLFVNGQSQVQAWNGAVATIASTTINTITISGTTSILDSGFYTSSHKSLTINGNTYTYTGVSGTTFTGVSGDPRGEANGSIIIQSVVTTAVSSFTSGPASNFALNLVKVLNNQVFYASLVSSVVWVTKVNSYTDFTQNTPRQSGDGWTGVLDDNIVAFIPQENYMYVSAGTDRWYNISFEVQTSTVGVTYEQVNALPLKTGKRQGAISQAATSHMKNNVIVVTNETTIDMIGRLENYFETPQTRNISDSIKRDIDSYDFTDCSIFYWRFYILVAVPVEGLVLMYNLSTNSWESPQTLPVSRFYIVDGELYGHSYNTLESYHLFTGYADRVYPGFSGFPIDFKAIFSYQNYGSRFTLKKANALYVEGYINQNTTVTCNITYELDGCASIKTFDINGSDRQYVCLTGSDGSLGKDSLGKIKLGGTQLASLTGLPPKFRVIPTFNNTDFFESSISFEVLGTDNRLELLAFGLNASGSSSEAVSIKV